MADPNNGKRRAPAKPGPSREGGVEDATLFASQIAIAQGFADAVRSPLLVLDPALRVVVANRPFCATFGLAREKIEGRLIYELDDGHWNIPRLRELLEHVLPIRGSFSNIEIEHDFGRAGRRSVLVDGRRIERQIVLSIEDLTERKQTERRQWLLIAEIRHRANNILAAVRAMASRTYNSSRSLKDFWIRFDGRLQALATAHNLATQSSHERVALHELVAEELRMHAIHESAAISIEGPDVELTGKGAEALAMTVHELTTNAIRHGALSDRDGRIDIRWSVQGDQLELEWRESGVPHVRRPRKRGFGLDIIEQGTKYTLDGEAEVKFGAHGIRCTVKFPLAPYAMTAHAQGGKGERHDGGRGG